MKIVLVNLEKNPQDNYDSIIPLFSYENKAATGFAAEYDVIIKKSTFSIQNHEPSKWSDDNYFLMGMAHYLKGDYPQAINHFTYITSAYKNGYKEDFLDKSKLRQQQSKEKKRVLKEKQDFKKKKKKNREKGKSTDKMVLDTRPTLSKLGHHPKRHLSLVWLARAFEKNEQTGQANSLLTFTESDQTFPHNFDLDLLMAKASIQIQQRNFDKAVDPLKQAIEMIKTKKKQARPLFVLAQIETERKNYKNAIAAYKQVLKSHPNFDMEFNAKLKLAQLATISGDGGKDARTLLLSMVKDGKNSELLDQIHYQIGKTWLNENNIPNAKSNFQKSIDKNKTNANQRGLSLLALGNIYFEDEDYVPSFAYYDSSSKFLTKEDPSYALMLDRKEKLGRLVTQVNIIETEDSLQQIASLPEADRKKRIENIIFNEVKKSEESKKALESSAPVVAAEEAGSGSSFYFYNSSTKNRGYSAFIKTWGDRKLEDNWRRSEKSSTEVTGIEGSSTENELTGIDVKENIKKLQDKVPVTKEAKLASDNKIAEAYFLLGNIYKDDFQNLRKAVESFLQVINKFPGSPFEPETAYSLFLAYTQLGQSAKAEEFKQLVVSKYPDSKFAAALKDPDFVKKMKSKDEMQNLAFKEIYDLYNASKYAEAESKANEALLAYKGSALEPQFAFYKVASLGASKKYDEYRLGLDELSRNYASHPVAEKAKQMLLYLSDLDQIKREDSILTAKGGYRPASTLLDTSKSYSIPKDILQAKDSVKTSVPTEKTPKEEKKKKDKKGTNNQPKINTDSIRIFITDSIKTFVIQDSIKKASPLSEIPEGVDLSIFTKEIKTIHRFIILPNDPALASPDLLNKVKAFNASVPAFKKYTVTFLPISATVKALVVKDFVDETTAMSYYQAITKDENIMKLIPKKDVKMFVCTSKNQAIAVSKGQVENAYYFFLKNYLKP